MTGLRVAESWRAIPSAARLLLVLELVNALGSGLVLPFLPIYVGRVHGYGPVAGAAAVSLLAAGSLLANPVAGWAGDRYGTRPVLLSGWLLAAGADVLLATAGSLPALSAAAMLVGVAAGVTFPLTHALLGHVTPDAQRPVVFACQHGLTNLGFGLGLTGAALALNPATSARYEALYLGDAVSFVLVAAALAGWAAAPTQRPAAAGRAQAGAYLAVLRDPAFRWVCTVWGLIVVFGYAQQTSMLPLYLSRPGALHPDQLAVTFAANMATVACAALPAAALTASRRRLDLLTAGACCFAAGWACNLFAHGSPGETLILAVCGQVSTGFGEVLLASALSPLVNLLAPDDLRARYNATYAMVLSVGVVVGPMLGSVVSRACGFPALLVTLLLGCLAAAALCRPRFTPLVLVDA